MYFDLAHAPFGKTYASSGSTDPGFTGQRQDTVAGLYDFPAREYSTQGRWVSPDPAGLGAVDPSNPQSWNRYAYVTNNPTGLVDPLGLEKWDAAASDGFPNTGGNIFSVNGGDCYFFQFFCGGGVPQPILVGRAGGGGGGGGAHGSSTGGTNPSNSNWCPPGDACDPTSNARQSQQQCLDQYNNSAAGKSIQFLSLYNLATNAGSLRTWAEWTALPYAKVKVLGWISKASQTMGNIEFWSLTSGAATPAAEVVAPTAAGISTVESVGGYTAPIAIFGSTVADIQIHAACAGYSQKAMMAPTVF